MSAPDSKELPLGEPDLELDKLRLDYAWKWFAFHADQRTKMFNYFILAIGIVATAVFSWYHQRGVVVILCAVGVTVALICQSLAGGIRWLPGIPIPKFAINRARSAKPKSPRCALHSSRARKAAHRPRLTSRLSLLASGAQRLSPHDGPFRPLAARASRP